MNLNTVVSRTYSSHIQIYMILIITRFVFFYCSTVLWSEYKQVQFSNFQMKSWEIIVQHMKKSCALLYNWERKKTKDSIAKVNIKFLYSVNSYKNPMPKLELTLKKLSYVSWICFNNKQKQNVLLLFIQYIHI